MNVLPAVGFGLLFLYIAKGNKIERRNALKSGDDAVYEYGNFPDIIGDVMVGETFTIKLPMTEGEWLLKATPPHNEVVLEAKILRADAWLFSFKAKKRGNGAIVIHRAISADTEPLEIIEVNVEVV